MSSLPEVSVILPAFNRLEYLRAAVDSVLAQTHTDWELIIADDGSEHATRKFLESLDDKRIRTIFLPHSGNPGAVRNRAIQQARSPYVAFLDSDDVWMPRKLQVQLDLMRRDRSRRWSYTRSLVIDERGDPVSCAVTEPSSAEAGSILEPLLRFEATIAMPSVVAERDLLNEVGGFDEQQRYGEDYDLWIRLAMQSEVGLVPEALVWVRNRHADRYSSDRRAAYVSWVRLYEKMDRIVPNQRLRSLCRRRRADASLILAGICVDQRDTLAVLHTVLAASTYAWPYPDWWWGACRAIARPVVPSRLRSMYRRLAG